MREIKIKKSTIEAVGNGDKKAFTKLFLDLYTPLVAYINVIICHKQDAEDIASNIFLDLPKLIKENYKDKGKFIEWLLVITKNRCKDYFKKQKNSKIKNADINQIPDEKLSKNFRIKELKSLLTKREFDILTLKYVSGYKTKEIAKITNLTVNVVAKTLSSAYAKTRTYYKENYK